MKKRILTALLALAAVLALLPAGAMAAEGGRTPICVGYADVDYLAVQILQEIPTQGKSATEQIRAVYDWVIRNCDRYDWDGTYYFDEQALSALLPGYLTQLQAQVDRGEVLLRMDLTEGEGYTLYDSNMNLAWPAYEMMLKRTGNCQHYSALLAVLLGRLGFDCRLIPGEFINGDGSTVEHKWNYVLVDGQYYWLDVRMDHATYASTGRIDHKYFMVSSTEEWARRHLWDHTYSDWLAANAADIQAAYDESRLAAPSEPWGKCDSWALDYMERAYDTGLMPERLYGEDLTAPITREEFAAVAVALYEALSGRTAPAYAGPSPFTDTADPDVLRAYALGVVNGAGGGLYAPDSPLTRQDAMTMLGRACELALTGAVGDGSAMPSAGTAPFADDSAIAGYAKNYVYYLVAQGAVNGTGNNQFSPKLNMDRQSALKTAVEAAARV